MSGDDRVSVKETVRLLPRCSVQNCGAEHE